MRSLLLVRHPRPLAEPGETASRWGLGADGLYASMALGDQLPPFTTSILSSTWPVAAQTARAMAGSRGHDVTVILDDRLDEIAGPGAPDDQDAAAVEYYLDGGKIASWEDPVAAVARFTDAVRAARHRELRATALVTHGAILALWLAPRVGMTPRRIWSQMTMPDLWCYDPAVNVVTRRPAALTSSKLESRRRSSSIAGHGLETPRRAVAG